MTREELFRAVGEVREDQIEAAETVKRQTHPWRRRRSGNSSERLGLR